MDSQERSHRESYRPQGSSSPATSAPLPGNPRILPREEHNISRKNIDPDAIKVMTRLLRNGYRAFLVGGGVRDLLLGRAPKDYDIGTDAKPESVRSLFRNSRIIGRRFRINHIYFTGGKIFELSTFRAVTEADPDEEVSPLRTDNTWGDPETDARRRDLTINGLFYDLSTFSVIDYVGGIEDLRNGIVRIIGDPETRFREDPVRMIRAVRHAARIGFTIEDNTYNAITKLCGLIRTASSARVFEELVREFTGKCAGESLRLLDQTGLLPELIPQLAERFEEGGDDAKDTFARTLDRLDQVTQKGMNIPLAVLFAAVFIGNLPKSGIPSELNEESKADVKRFWALSPFPEQEVENQEQPREASSRKIRSHGLELSVDELLKPLGVPRKDRERIPQLLTARYGLIALYKDGGEQRSIITRSYFADALLLLRLTGHTAELQECFNFWYDKAYASDQRRPANSRPSGEGRRPSRGGRRRRRGGGGKGAGERAE